MIQVVAFLHFLFTYALNIYNIRTTRLHVANIHKSACKYLTIYITLRIFNFSFRVLPTSITYLKENTTAMFTTIATYQPRKEGRKEGKKGTNQTHVHMKMNQKVK